MAVTAGDICLGAAQMLNDATQTLFTFDELLPFLQDAVADAQDELELNQIPYTHEISALYTIPAGNQSITSPPSDISYPILINERQAGSSSLFTEMTEKTWEEDWPLTDALRYWVWREGGIRFPKASTNREIQVFYARGLSVPAASGDPIEPERLKKFLEHQTASIAAATVLQDYDRAKCLASEAKEALAKFIAINVRRLQNRPVRRRGFQYSLRRRR